MACALMERPKFSVLLDALVLAATIIPPFYCQPPDSRRAKKRSSERGLQQAAPAGAWLACSLPCVVVKRRAQASSPRLSLMSRLLSPMASLLPQAVLSTAPQIRCLKSTASLFAALARCSPFPSCAIHGR